MSESDETERATDAAAATLQSRSCQSAILCDSCFSYRLSYVVEGFLSGASGLEMRRLSSISTFWGSRVSRWMVRLVAMRRFKKLQEEAIFVGWMDDYPGETLVTEV